MTFKVANWKHKRVRAARVIKQHNTALFLEKTLPLFEKYRSYSEKGDVDRAARVVHLILDFPAPHSPPAAHASVVRR